MSNILTKQNFQSLLPYLPGEAGVLASALFKALPRDVQLSDSLSLYVADALHTIVEIDDTAGSYPLLVIAKSNGTACTVKLYLDDADDVSVGTTDAVLSVGVSGTADEITGAIMLGAGVRTLAAVSGNDGLSVAAPATDVGTGTVASDPTIYVLYHNAA